MKKKRVIHPDVGNRQRIWRWLLANGCRDIVALEPVTIHYTKRGKIIEYQALCRQGRLDDIRVKQGLPVMQKEAHVAALRTLGGGVMNIANAAEWKALVYLYRGPGVSNDVRVLLLYLADHMGANRVVSVPRSTIARDLNISEREVTQRIKAAREAGLLDTADGPIRPASWPTTSRSMPRDRDE